MIKRAALILVAVSLLTIPANAAFDPRAQALLDKADTLLKAGDSARALNSYIEAVNIDASVADLATINRYATLFIAFPNGDDKAKAQQARDLHIAALRQYLRLRPNDLKATRDLATLVDRKEAESLAARLVQLYPENPEAYRARANVKAKFGGLRAAIDDYQKASDLEPQNAEGHHLVGVVMFNVVRQDTSLSDQQRQTFIQRGIAAFERAETLQPDYLEAITYRGLLIRQQAELESNPSKKTALIARADELRARAMALLKARQAAATGESPAITRPLRVGGDVKAPVITHRVEPQYPDSARKARVGGMVIAEVLIDKTGNVANARVIKGLPHGLDEAALNAVKQWKFRPATLNAQPVDVIFNLTVNFPLPPR